MLKKFLIVSLAAALIAGAAIAFIGISYTSPGPLESNKTVIIKKGSGFKQIVQTLEDEGIVHHAALIAIPAVALDQHRSFKPGEYAFLANVSPKQVLEALANGEVVVHKISIVEGTTAKQVVALLENEQALEGDIIQLPAEGSLLPETYHFTRGDTRQAIIDRMQSDMQNISTELWNARQDGLPFESLDEAIILASIVEKEAQIGAERPHIASVYINRIRKGMKLQADPTTIYAVELADGKSMDRPLYKRDLKRDLPHNTYMREGLPPTPIANPGKASIKATLNPKKTNDLFFVARGDGGHYFARTYAEHKRNIVKYKAALQGQ